ncbi:killer cell immunoglobulin-like receptor 3DL1, partial [Mugil cephalus]|uniref:killer cell immunoglobulin-like receptor 3DL1 n=1 Tax=Mugil cephalus TaxID=48193 RepID=UPI001FB5F855
MGHTFLCVLLLTLLDTLLYCGHAQDAVLTTDPYWSPLFTGESVTFICDMKEGGVTDWDYKINKDGGEFTPYNIDQRYTLNPLSPGHSGEYQCCGSHKRSSQTKCSKTVTLTVSASDIPRATLKSGPTTIPVGGRVTLTCSVEPSAGWKYEWFRHSTDTSEVQVETNDGENRVISVSQGGIYWCRGGRGRRGEPVYYTYDSDPVTIEIIIPNKAVVTRQHNWPQIFRGENITLTCEVQGGEDTEWIYDWRKLRSSTHWTNNKYWTFTASESSSGDYMCRSRLRDDSYSSTEWSEAITLSVSGKQPVLSVSPSWLSPGASVTLSCEVEHPSAGWRFYWYKAVPDLSHKYQYSNDELLPGSINGTEQDSYIIDGQTHTAGYVCRAGRGEPVFYTDY